MQVSRWGEGWAVLVTGGSNFNSTCSAQSECPGGYCGAFLNGAEPTNDYPEVKSDSHIPTIEGEFSIHAHSQPPPVRLRWLRQLEVWFERTRDRTVVSP